MKDRRAEGVAQIREMAEKAFARHAIANVSEDRIVCKAPKSSAYAFEVAVLGWGRVIVHGDLEPIIFRGGDGGPLVERLRWIAGGEVDYLHRKASYGRRDYLIFDAEALADDLESLADDAVESAVPGYDPSEFQGRDDDDEGEGQGTSPADRAPYPGALAPDLSDVTSKRIGDCRRIAAYLRRESPDEHDAWDAVYRAGLDLGGSAGKVYDASLLWAIEAARVAFRLLSAQTGGAP